MIFEGDDARLARLQHLYFGTCSEAHFLEPRHERFLTADFEDATRLANTQEIQRNDVMHANLRRYALRQGKLSSIMALETKSQRGSPL